MRTARDRRTPALHAGSQKAAGHSDICSLYLACMTPEEACAITMDWFKQNFPQVSGNISLFSETQEYLETVVSWPAENSQCESFRSSDCWALRRGRPHHFSADSGSGLAQCHHYEADGSDWHLCLPMMAAGAVIGLVHFHGAGLPPGHSGDDHADADGPPCNLEVIAADLAMAISSLNLRKTLQEQAIRDPLTQLFNRRYLEYTLQRELYQAERAQVPLTLAILDVDHFKAFNDQFGHDAGDAVLINVGAVLLKHMRGGDIACRFGGEEFALVYPGMPPDVAMNRLEVIRQQVGALSLSHRNMALDQVTISSGIAVYPDHGQDIETLINSADQALYQSKEQGRDRVTMWQADGGDEDSEKASLTLIHDRDAAQVNGGKS